MAESASVSEQRCVHRKRHLLIDHQNPLIAMLDRTAQRTLADSRKSQQLLGTQGIQKISIEIANLFAAERCQLRALNPPAAWSDNYRT